MKNLLWFPISVISHESSEPNSLFYPLQKRKGVLYIEQTNVYSVPPIQVQLYFFLEKISKWKINGGLKPQILVQFP
jgi:hypothetical protein